ncbi:alpha/beta-hydrolase [Setomelanomma holmii]|uniref:Alpha/beta-hydrolase n=1 Tax=Setomelanomma holmii TaxID=210430 RepID=A0A9P4LNS1_9PLEO|nr:alpha/beta-hydrolase [Setomelanomma holmii]
MSFFYSLILSVLLWLKSDAAPLVQEKRGIQANQLSSFKLMREYASAAYCASNFGSSGDQITCAAGNCPNVEAADSATSVEFDREDTSTDVAGYVAVDHTNKLIVVSFRGSTTIDAWITNFDFDTVDTDICSGCTAHHGFWNSWVDARNLVTPAVKQASTTYPTYQIRVVGHSLGGAIASLAAAQLRNYGLTVALYNFGSPRIGGTKISSYITNQSDGNYRITHLNDPVPKVPLLTMGYVHISPEYYINKPDKQDVNAGDIQVFNGAANLFVGNQASLIPDVDAHRWYFASVYTCDAKKSKRGVLEIRGVEQDVEIIATF